MEYETVLEASEIKSHKYYVSTNDGIYNFLGKKIFGNYIQLEYSYFTTGIYYIRFSIQYNASKTFSEITNPIKPPIR